jgi:hypothetical protein
MAALEREDGWRKYYDEKGKPYYHNSTTSESLWELPPKTIIELTPMTESAEVSEVPSTESDDGWDIVLYIHCHGRLLYESLTTSTTDEAECLRFGFKPKSLSPSYEVRSIQFKDDYFPMGLSSTSPGVNNFIPDSSVLYNDIGSFVTTHYPMNKEKLDLLQRQLRKSKQRVNQSTLEKYGEAAAAYDHEEGFYIGTIILDRDLDAYDKLDGIYVLEDRKGIFTKRYNKGVFPINIFKELDWRWGVLSRSRLLQTLYDLGYRKPLFIDNSCGGCNQSSTELRGISLSSKRQGMIGGTKHKKRKSKAKTKRKNKI